MKALISLLAAVFAMLANANVHAQESSRAWTSPGVGTFNTQKEVEAAIHERKNEKRCQRHFLMPEKRCQRHFLMLTIGVV